MPGLCTRNGVNRDAKRGDMGEEECDGYRSSRMESWKNLRKLSSRVRGVMLLMVFMEWVIL